MLKQLFIAVVATAAVATSQSAVAQPDVLNLQGGSSALCPGPDQLSLERPLSSEGATRVSVGVFVVDLVELDDVNQSFTADFTLILQWLDPSLADPARGASLSICPLAVAQVWRPVVEFEGVRRFEKHHEDVTGIDAAGTITHAQRLSLDIAVPLDLRDFPFDRHTLAVELIPVFSGVDEVAFVVLPELTGVEEDVSLTGWTLGTPAATTETRYAPRIQVNQAVFRLQIETKREAGFYVWKMLVPLTLIVFMSWAVFWVDPQEIGPQLGLAATSMLTLIAFQFAFADLLPRISYLSRADRFILSSSLLVFLALVEAVTASTLARTGRAERAHRLDRISRLAFPAVLAAIIVFSFVM